jgi:hypothetical protein
MTFAPNTTRVDGTSNSITTVHVKDKATHELDALVSDLKSIYSEILYPFLYDNLIHAKFGYYF